MFNWVSKLLMGGLGATAQGVSRAVATFTGDKVQRESHVSEEAMAVHSSYRAEFGSRENRTWWDSLIDGINRIPRPAMALSVIGLLVWPAFDPAQFAAAMQAYSLVPDWLAGTFVVVVGFYFTTRGIEKIKLGGGPSPEEVQQVLDTQERIRGLGARAPTEDVPAETKLTNGEIIRWNQTRRMK